MVLACFSSAAYYFAFFRQEGHTGAGCSAEGQEQFPSGWPQVYSDRITSVSHASSMTFHAGPQQ